MNKMDMITFLVADATGELKKIDDYEAAHNLGDRQRIFEAAIPSRQRIKDDLKMVRRLSIEVEREARRRW